MKKINRARVVWIISVFLGLIIVLFSIMDYKIHFQYKTKNKIYFYDCSGTLCVTEVKDDSHLLYSEYNCNYNTCPAFKSEIEDKYVILDNKEYSILFDYRKGKIISKEYQEYKFLNNDYIIVTKDKKQGIINLKNKVKIPVEYDEIGYKKDNYLIGYNLSFIIVKKEDKYGIISIKNGSIVEEINYKEEQIDDLLKLLNNKYNS